MNAVIDDSCGVCVCTRRNLIITPLSGRLWFGLSGFQSFTLAASAFSPTYFCFYSRNSASQKTPLRQCRMPPAASQQTQTTLENLIIGWSFQYVFQKQFLSVCACLYWHLPMHRKSHWSDSLSSCWLTPAIWDVNSLVVVINVNLSKFQTISFLQFDERSKISKRWGRTTLGFFFFLVFLHFLPFHRHDFFACVGF